MRSFVVSAIALAAAGALVGGASGAGPDWQSLQQRPLHLPALASGGRCPANKLASQLSGKKYGVGGAVGPGPVYAVLGRASLFTVFRPGWGKWAGQKVLWFVLPSYKGPLLIRGRRLGGAQLMRFDGGKNPAAEIRIAPGQTVTWKGQAPGSRGRPSDVRVRTPGCYGVQIDGTSFSEVVVFPVSTGR